MTARNPPILDRPMPLRAGALIDISHFASIRRRMILDCCKWDPQVGDQPTLAPFPLLINRDDWNELSDLAERLTAELLAAERELSHRPELHRLLAIPRSIRRVLSTMDSIGPTPAAVRTMRFDFHWTREGWRISEVNSDVPGGFSEASEMTRMMRRILPETTAPGDAGACWAEAMSLAAAERTMSRCLRRRDLWKISR